MTRFQTVRGTRDILPGEIETWQKVEALVRELFERYGFREIRTPIFEPTELFARGVGASTDIVRKEMYTFVSGDDSVTLRPEMTASVVRALIQHGLARVPGAERLFYLGPMFRRERPQKGRQRQFHQIGVEVFGIEDPYIDAETIEMVLALLTRLGVSGLSLRINSVGCTVCRPGYRAALRAWLDPLAPTFCADCQRRIEENPLRVFDCKVQVDKDLLQDAPTSLDHLCDACRDHFSKFRGYLTTLEIQFAVDPRLVRGLDYYVKTAFEILAQEGLGSQNALMGGGRYDGLVKELGGPDLAGFGWALGIERLMMLLGAARAEGAAIAIVPSADLFVAHIGDAATARSIGLVKDFRAQGLSVRFDPRAAKLGAQMKRADREGARFALILGDEEIAQNVYQVKDMRSGGQEPVHAAALAALVERIRNAREN